MRAVRADAIWSAIDDLGATHMCGACPTVCTTIVGASSAHALVRPLRITTAGAPPSPTIIGQLSALGITVVHVYGLTEVYGPFTICEYQDAWDDLSADDRAKKLSRQGVSMVQAEDVRVIDRDAEGLVDVPADGESMGEILLRGNNVMAGFKDPAATAEAFAGGWFHTGDLGVMHPDGYVQLRDRVRTSSSPAARISPPSRWNRRSSVTTPCSTSPSSASPTRNGANAPRLRAPRPGRDLTADELIDYARKLLAGYKIPATSSSPTICPAPPPAR